MSDSEFSRMVKARPLPPGPLTLEPNEAERAALADRFGISAVNRLVATVELDEAEEGVRASGTLEADIVQPCAVSGEDFANHLAEPIRVTFVPLRAPPGDEEEIELEAEDLDDIEYEGESFDLGEAVAQTLGLAIDPYAEGPGADEARKTAGISGDDAPSGPLADALAALKNLN